MLPGGLLLRHPLRPYPYTLLLFNERDAYSAYLRSTATEGDGDRHFRVSERTFGQTAWKLTRKEFVVGVFRTPDGYDPHPATLAHELSHVLIGVFEQIGMPLNDDTSEAFCYLMGEAF